MCNENFVRYVVWLKKFNFDSLEQGFLFRGFYCRNYTFLIEIVNMISVLLYLSVIDLSYDRSGFSVLYVVQEKMIGKLGQSYHLEICMKRWYRQDFYLYIEINLSTWVNCSFVGHHQWCYLSVTNIDINSQPLIFTINLTINITGYLYQQK